MKQTQHDKILAALRAAGDKGINSFQARIDLRIIQLPTRIWELKRMNYNIVEKINADKSVNYILAGEPPKPEKPRFRYEGNLAIRI